jgi:hypothetical protein
MANLHATRSDLSQIGHELGSRLMVLWWVLVSVVACTLEPTPTQVEPTGSIRVEIGYDNQSDGDFVITLAEGGEVRAWATVDPCAANSMTASVDEPFEIGIGPGPPAQAVEEAEPTVIDSLALGHTPQQRVLIRIAADGSTTVGPLNGPTEVRDGPC